ncbi:MAG: DUF2442 domain-containing protein [Isosphaeraceae bacterium]|nr:DUF2442 domain-containing protein [Isosphaeraceae bacterium]
MPTVPRHGPYRFFFDSGDRDEPSRVHVERDDREAKFCLSPVRVERSRGFAGKEINVIQSIRSSRRTGSNCWTNGMNTSTVESRPVTATSVIVTDDTLTLELSDGRSVSAPLAWYPRLLHGAAQERSRCRLIGQGLGIHWPDLDEDVSVANLLAGSPSGESQYSLKRWLEQRAGGHRSPENG